ncbi:MAG: hypothetical protein AAGC81_10605, partial [Pseudomonadota bacterium]
FGIAAAQYVNRLTEIWDNANELTSDDLNESGDRYELAKTIVNETEQLNDEQALNIDAAMGELEFLKDNDPRFTEEGKDLIPE